MAELDSLNGQIKNSRSKVFRKLFVKRRDSITGLHETTWQELSEHVIKWGRVESKVDANRINQYTYSNVGLEVDNSDGKFNENTNQSSFWYGYESLQRSLIKIEAGFLYQAKGSDGLWVNTEYPTTSEIFHGIITGNINYSNEIKVKIPIAPLLEVFRQFPADRMNYTLALTDASGFFVDVRDQQDSAGSAIFSTFFGNTSTQWDLTSVPALGPFYLELTNDSTTSNAVQGATLWDIMQKIAQTVNCVVFIGRDGLFTIRQRSTLLASQSTTFSFFGLGNWDNTHGRNIKKINFYGDKVTKFYPRVSVHHDEGTDKTSYEIKREQFAVTATSNLWLHGERTLDVENTFVQNTAQAIDIASALASEFGTLRKEIDLTTSFVPHLSVNDKVEITYDAGTFNVNNLWDQNNWADSIGAADAVGDLIWDPDTSSPFTLNQDVFRIIKVSVNLDTFECKFTGRAE